MIDLLDSVIKKNDDDLLSEKLLDMEQIGFEIELTPEEAETMGAFEETALSYEDAINSIFDDEGI